MLEPDIQRSIPGGRDTPLIIDLDKTYLVTLEKNGESFFQLSDETGELAIVLDSVLTNRRDGTLQSTLSVLDSDGAVIKNNLLNFNELDSGFRKTATLPVKNPGKYGFKVLNKSYSSVFRLTVMERATFRFVPFADEGIPSKLVLDEPGTGTLDKYQSEFYRIFLPKGDYKVLLDFTNANDANTIIQGYLAALDAFGGGQATWINFNEIDVSHRKAKTFSLDEARTLIWRVKNRGSTIRYQLRILKQ